jgi:hypothetical protein
MIDPIGELKYRLALANEHLRRAEMYCPLGDWAECVHYSQLSIENFAKALISMYEVPTWSRDPSNQLLTLLNQLPGRFKEYCEGVGTYKSRGGRGTCSIDLWRTLEWINT